MDWTIIPILIAIVALVTVVAGIGSDMFQSYLKFRARQMELMADKAAEQASHYAKKAESLEQRVRVLERIAIDRGADLAAQIEHLRGDGTDHKENMQ